MSQRFSTWFRTSDPKFTSYRRNQRRSSGHGLNLESLERRELLTKLAVDIGDPNCGIAGDNLYCEIQEAIDAAEEGDNVLVSEGTYEPISIEKNELSIKAVGGGEVIIDVNAVDIQDACINPDFGGLMFSPCGPAELGVELNADGVTIEGLTVTGARGYGMFVTGDHNRLQDNVVENTSGVCLDSDADGVIDGDCVGHGIALQDAHHNTLIKNTARDNGGDFDVALPNGPVVFSSAAGHGIALQGSHHNSLIGNTAQDNSRWGVDLRESNFNTIVSNTFTGNVNGIEVSATSAFNVVHGNRASGNNNGFVLGDGDSNKLSGNVAEENNARGFFLIFGSSDNVLTGNTARNNGQQGFLLVFGTESNILRGNVAEGNGTAGISSDDEGFTLAFGANKNTLQGNISRNNAGSGFLLTGSEFNTLQGNMALQNGGNGFDVLGESNGNTLKANTANSNAGDGFHLEASDLNTFENNTAVRNKGWGFFVDEVLANEFDNNNCQLNELGDANVAGIC